ncbi:MAG: hypothetical protein FWC91_01320 [Defluviitaleaceae bacterium]|nr:hypothetical protein [Defluviitaleaceae bacterium]
MIGIISAQNNIQLAIQNQGIANSTYRHGRIRERNGITDGNSLAIEEGQALQAEGKEKQVDTFRHLGYAMNDLNTAAESYEECSECEFSAGNNPKNSYADSGYIPGEFNVVIGDTISGSANRNSSVPRQNSIDIVV